MNAHTRHLGHKGLEHLEWIERHVTTRRDDSKLRDALMWAIEDLRKILLKVAGANVLGEKTTQPRRLSPSTLRPESPTPPRLG